MSATSEANERPDYDPELQAIADYVLNYQVVSDEALETADSGGHGSTVWIAGTGHLASP